MIRHDLEKVGCLLTLELKIDRQLLVESDRNQGAGNCSKAVKLRRGPIGKLCAR